MRTHARDADGDGRAGDVSALVDRWVAGWALSRDRPSALAGRIWRVDVASEFRAVEYVIANPDQAEARALCSAVRGRPDGWVTVVGEVRADATAEFAGLVTLEHAESLMTATLADLATEVARTSSGDVEIDVRGAVAFARIEVGGDVVAAEGQVALSGSDAILDRIRTHPEFRRRGLGSVLMAALTAWAVEQGATTGLLVASEQGRALYTRLGWQDAAPVTTYRGVLVE